MYNAVGFIIYFKIAVTGWRQEVRMMISESRSPEDLIRFKFKKNDFNVSTHEFIKDGRLYDVSNITVDGDYILVDCLPDIIETNLLAAFNDVLLQNINLSGESQKNTPLILKLLLAEYLYDKTDLFLLRETTSQNLKINLEYNSVFFSNYILDILTPPPQGQA